MTLQQSIISADVRARYDMAAKNLLASKQILLEALESSENAFEEIADIVGIDIVELPAYTTSDFDKQAPRNRRFQILLTDQIMGKLKQQSLETGLSCNEIICQAISKYLATETD